MTTKDQHYVPRVYLKRWSHNQSEQVYYYAKNNLREGEPRNVHSILHKRHIYTITFNDYYLLKYMPSVEEDFIQKIKNILSNYSATAYYDGQELKDTMLVNSNALYNIDQWEFRKTENPELPPKRRGILENIKSVRSYVLEKKLDDFVEKKWNSLLDTFLNQLNKGHQKRISDKEDIVVDKDLIEELVSFMLISMCRHPDFDYQGIFPRIKDYLKSIKSPLLPSDVINQQMRGVWLYEIYKALFNNDIGFFSEFLKKIKKSCQMTILYCSPDNGGFITTDTPAFTFLSNVTSKNNNAIYFPLTPEYLMVIGNGKNNSLNRLDRKDIHNTDLKRFNSIILNNATQCVVSNQKYLGYLL